MKLITVLLFLFLIQNSATAQHSEIPEFLKDPQYRSSRNFEKKANSDGNRVWITFFNTGLLGGIGEIRGQWPRGSGVNYIGDVSPVVALEVPVDTDGDGIPDELVQHAITNRGPRAGQSREAGDDKFYGFEPMAGFANNDGINDRPAVSTDESTWPSHWPDQPEWIGSDGKAEWNGFFGRGIQNADFETYFWVDDHNDEELYEDYGFLPDSTDASRLGQGLAMSVRGMQWSQFLAQDAMFYVYELTNTGTTTYPRVSVGLVVGTAAGEPSSTASGDTQDDLAFFDQANRIVYSWDSDGTNITGGEVGYVGYAFMESPGDPNDGIDNDGDGDPSATNVDGVPYIDPSLAGTGNIFTNQDFQPRTINAGDPIILIDQQTGERSFVFMENGPMTVTSQGIEYELTPGITLEETKKTIQGQIDEITVTDKNLIDEDLDGIIDEDILLHYERRQQAITGEVVILPALRYKNYVGFANDVQNGTPTRQDSINHGLLNPMIDESADDGIDNDGDWNALTDDVGADGVAGTGDFGEGDGKPTVGEPNFEHLDVDETDQVGLSSFYYFTPPGAVRLNDDAQVWSAMSPGFFTTNNELAQQQAQGGIDGDFIFSSGYFRMEPGQTLRFSLALVFGEDLASITNNVTTIQEIYNRNYSFARPPEKPTLSAAVGDERVTLYWNSIAEESIDPILGKDFEGYKIFKSTDPNFLDPGRITDAFGNDALLEPLAQFDLDNGIKGLWQAVEDTSSSGEPIYVYNPDLADRVRGVPFYLGDDTGLQHSFVDTNVVNGQTYYYALVAYDRGSKDFYPAENNYAVTLRDDGTIITDINVVMVEPNTPVLGYEAGTIADDVEHTQGAATGEVFVEILDPFFLEENSIYEISFEGSELSANTFTVKKDGQVINTDVPLGDANSTIFDGMRLSFQNHQSRVNVDASSWAENDDSMIDVLVREGTLSNNPFWKFDGIRAPYDYEVIFSDEVIATSLDTTNGTGLQSRTTPAQDVKFKVRNATTGKDVPFAFDETQSTTAGDGELGDREYVYIYDTFGDSLNVTYEFRIVYETTTGGRVPTGDLPQPGDVYTIRTYKAFRNNDIYAFSTKSSKIDKEEAKKALDEVRVVPNPYVSAASWEKGLPPTITSGRGERKVQFQNVPKDATIRIFTVRGELVRELKHEGSIDRGYVDWDLRTRENLDVAYGVYYYHLEAPGLGTKTGKIALIK